MAYTTRTVDANGNQVLTGPGMPTVRITNSSTLTAAENITRANNFMKFLNDAYAASPVFRSFIDFYYGKSNTLEYTFVYKASDGVFDKNTSPRSYFMRAEGRVGRLSNGMTARFEISGISFDRLLSKSSDYYEFAASLVHELAHKKNGFPQSAHHWDQKTGPASWEQVASDESYKTEALFRLDLGIAAPAGGAQQTANDQYNNPVTGNVYYVTVEQVPNHAIGDMYARGNKVFKVVTKEEYLNQSAKNTYNYLKGRASSKNVKAVGDSSAEEDAVFSDGTTISQSGLAKKFRTIDYSQAGSVIGTTLGNYLAKDNKLAGVLYSSLLGEIGERIGAALAGSPGVNMSQTVDQKTGEVINEASFGQDVFSRMKSAAAGLVSSALMAELANSLGLKGFGAEIFTAGASSVLGQVITNGLNGATTAGGLLNGIAIQDPHTGKWDYTGAGNLLGSALGSYFGSKLGAMIVKPQTEAAVILSSVGSAVGAWWLGRGVSGFLNVLGATGWGALVGFVIGALIGNLFGKKKPRTPTANAETVLQIPYAQYALGSSTSANGGSLNLVIDMASNARDILNGLISQITYNDERALVSNLNGYNTTQVYGHTGNQLYVKVNGLTHNVNSADEAVEYGTLIAIRNTKIISGDLFLKRAITNSNAQDLVALSGDMTTAKDYAFYGANKEVVDGYIKDAFPSSANPTIQTQYNADMAFYNGANKGIVDKILSGGIESLTSSELGAYNGNKTQYDRVLAMVGAQTIANPWIITLLRASELKLDQWAASDFYGGLKGFLDSFDLKGHNLGYENISFNDLSGWNVGITATGTGADGLFNIMPTSTNNGRTVIINNLPSTAIGYQGGYTVNAHATGGNDILWASGANPETIDDYANVTVWVESGYWQQGHWTGYDWEEQWIDTSHWETQTVSGGDDIFNGGQGNDTLNGRDGWDWLDGKDGHDVIFGGDGNDVLIGGAGNDHLDGQGGDDYIAAGDGGDGAYGGDGNDILVDGQGSECLIGQNGDDTFLIAEDYTFNWFWGGDLPHVNPGIDPNGKDTISAERLSVGVSFDIDGHPSDWTPSHPDPVASNPAARAAIIVNAQTGAWITSEGLFSIENATGSRYGDVIYGATDDNVLKGLGGDDKLYGRDGNDTIEGGVGADQLFGGNGFDYVSYYASGESVSIDLSTGEAFRGDADGDILSEFEGIKGSKFSDDLKGNAADNIILGDAGEDWIYATAGNDTYDGGIGLDKIYFSNATSGVTAYLGSYGPTTTAYGSASGGYSGNKSLISIEGIVGSVYADSLSGGDGEHSIEGGKGNDTLNGGNGADTYYFSRGDGQDVVTETNVDNNKVTFAGDIKFRDLYVVTAGGYGGYLDLSIRGTSDKIRFNGNFATLSNNRLKVLDMNGAGQLSLGLVANMINGSDSADFIQATGSADLILGHNGNDTLRGNGSSTLGAGDTYVGGLGDDYFEGFYSDDDYGYDRGDGKDVIWELGGEDTLIFGSSVTSADDVLFEINQDTGDLWIGLKGDTYAGETASQVADNIKILTGGTIETISFYYEGGGGPQDIVFDSVTYHRTIEFVQVAGVSIDLNKLNLDWKYVETDGGYGHYYPIALDLDADGLDLIAVKDSGIVSKVAQGGLSRMGWVGPTDGFLAVDRNGDGAINKLSEISFTQDKPGAKSDLEGLKTWDTNGDNRLDKNDLNFNKILLWQDLNQNGRSTQKELKTLTQAGISAIDLNGLATGNTAATSVESYIQNQMKFIWADGREGAAFDIALARSAVGFDAGYQGKFKDEWGSANADGTLGVLKNDPIEEAKADRIRLKKALINGISASYQEIKAKAQTDFGDNDKIDSKIAQRWEKKSKSERAAWLSGQATVVDDKVRLMSAEQSLLGTITKAKKATGTLASIAQDQASATAGASNIVAASGRTEASSPATSLGASLSEPVGLGLALTASEPDLGVSTNRASAGANSQAWWLTEAFDAGLSSGNSLSSLLSSMESGVPSTPSNLAGASDQSLTQQQLLLLQAMASFTGNGAGGVAAATWSRTDAGSTASLAAASALNRMDAPSLAMA